MKFALRAFGALFLCFFTVLSPFAQEGERADAVDLRSEYVVVLKPEARAGGARMAAAHGASHVYTAVFSGFSASLSPRAAQALRDNPRVESVEPVFYVHATAETLPTGVDRIDAEKAHQASHFGIGANVAVIDTGIDLDHPDLGANVNLALSRTFVSFGKTTTGGDDDNGHGSHVAGTVAAVLGNNIGAVGVAPGASLIALKVLNRQGSGSSADIIAALDYITAHNNAAAGYAACIQVANCSFGGSGTDTPSAYRTAFNNCVASGCFISVAAGNSGTNAANFIPAAYDSVFTVSAMNPVTGAFASFSNWGADVDMAAPGVSIYSTYKNGSYNTFSGTSMAAPHVAGTAALYVGHNLAGMNRATAESQIRTALLTAGEYVPLPGDPDAHPEPLVDAETIFGPPAPAVNVSIATDKSAYTTADTSALLIVTVRDETNAPINGLSNAQVVTTGAPQLSFAAVGNGMYEVSIDISGFTADTPFNVTVTVTDNRPVVGDDFVIITRATVAPPPPPPPPGTIFVSNIGYRTQGPHLWVDVTIGADSSSVDVSGVSVAITLNRNNSAIASGSGTTGSNGRVSFRLQHAPAGNYSTTINGVTKSGLTYDPNLNAADPGFTK